MAWIICVMPESFRWLRLSAAWILPMYSYGITIDMCCDIFAIKN